MGFVTVRDEWTKFVGHRFLNSQICLWIGVIQMVICCWGVAQHGHSYLNYHKILYCDFLEGSLLLEASDAVIFDIGLFNSLWGIRGCVAEYLDGGFGRLAWCLSHIASLLVSLPFAFASRPRPCYLWPLLIQQSLYGVCLLILLLAALPRILPLLTEPHAAPVAPILVYITGTALNFFLLYVMWHWYWHVNSQWSSARRVRFGSRVINANMRSRRDKPMLPKEEMNVPAEEEIDHIRRESFPPRITPRKGSAAVVETVHDKEPKQFVAYASPLSQNVSRESTRMDCVPVSVSTTSTMTLSATTPPPSPPRPVIYATRLDENSKENRSLRAQAAARSTPRRRLPPTPQEPMHGELPPHRRRHAGPILLLPHAII